MVTPHRPVRAVTSSRPLVQMAWLSALVLVGAVLFGGLPRSAEVRQREARADLVSSGRPDLTPTTTTTSTVPDVADPVAVTDALVAAGFPDVIVTAEGSSVVLSGTVPDEASRRVVASQARAVPGVTDVVDRTTVKVVPVAGDVSIVAGTRSVEVSGRVPDRSTADAVLEAVASVYPSDQIVGTVEIDPATVGPVRITGSATSTRVEVPDLLVAALDEIDPSLATSDLDVGLTTPARLEEELAAVLEDSTIEFASGSATIDRPSQFTLDVIAAVLSDFPDAALEIGGHTDAVGDAPTNLALSRDRAEAVVDSLRERGVDNRLESVGYGELRPLAGAGNRSDRRIEFTLILP